ncbi:MAG: hypothetical protein U0795_23000 [Pirellulales bacterium]
MLSYDAELVSSNIYGWPAGQLNQSSESAVSDDGRYVVFVSNADNIVADDQNGRADVFLRDMQQQEVRRITLPDHPAFGDPVEIKISDDGTAVVYRTAATGITADGLTYVEVSKLVLYDVMTQQSRVLDRDDCYYSQGAYSGSLGFDISRDGDRIVYSSHGNYWQANGGFVRGTSQVFLFDAPTLSAQLISRSYDTTQLTNGPSDQPRISPDGAWVVFSSVATNLVPGIADHNGGRDVFRYDTSTGAVQLVSVSTSQSGTGEYASERPQLSDDGSKVLFFSRSTNLVSGYVDVEGVHPEQLFVADAKTGRTTLITKTAVTHQIASVPIEFSAEISGDGRYVVFNNASTQLVPGFGLHGDIFRYDITADRLEPITVNVSGTGGSDGLNLRPRISRDGSRIFFTSLARNLTLEEPTGVRTLMVYDHTVGSIAIVASSIGWLDLSGTWHADTASINGDGTTVVYTRHTNSSAQLTEVFSAEVPLISPVGLMAFDFGTAQSPVEYGAARVTAGDRYVLGKAGWLSTMVDERDRGTTNSFIRDFNFSADATFRLDVAEGTYQVTATLGDDGYAHDEQQIFVNGQLAGAVTTRVGEHREVNWVTTVVDGHIDVRLRDGGGPDPYATLNLLVVRRVKSAPGFHFDFGLPTSPVAAGYQGVTPSTVYSVGGFGMRTPALEGRDRQVGDEVARDFVFGSQLEFLADVPSGSYTVTIQFHDALYAHDDMQLQLEGLQVGNVSTLASQIVERRYSNVQVRDGIFNLLLKDVSTPGRDPYVILNGIDLVPESLVATNPISNGSFETGAISPDGWSVQQYLPTGQSIWTNQVAQDGTWSAGLYSSVLNDIYWEQQVQLEPNVQYWLSGWIRTENVSMAGAGASLAINGTWSHTPGLHGTNDWTFVALPFNAGESGLVTVAGRLGFWSDMSSGLAWFDNLQVTLADPNPAGAG